MTRFSETPSIYLRSSTSFSERASYFLLRADDPDLNLMGSTTPQRSRCAVRIVGYCLVRDQQFGVVLLRATVGQHCTQREKVCVCPAWLRA